MYLDDLTTISRADHDARRHRGEVASGTYAIVFPRQATIQPHLTHSYDLRDSNDEYLESGAACGPAMARRKAQNLGATFIVEGL